MSDEEQNKKLEDRLKFLKECQKSTRQYGWKLEEEIREIEMEIIPVDVKKLKDLLVEINKILEDHHLNIFVKYDYDKEKTGCHISFSDNEGAKKVEQIYYKGQYINI